jgi:cytoskeletal protein CcmA (bactofilin family)
LENNEMPLANTALQVELTTSAENPPGSDPKPQFPPRRPNEKWVGEHVTPARPPAPSFVPRIPVITGEATYRGHMPVEGTISGQLSAGGGTMVVKQRPRNVRAESTPELDGEISFKDMLRINGHVAGSVLSNKGTLIIDEGAQVDARIEVGVALVSGTVKGEIVARQRVELASGAIIFGNISTPKLSIRPGATFHGDCRMLLEETAQ